MEHLEELLISEAAKPNLEAQQALFRLVLKRLQPIPKQLMEHRKYRLSFRFLRTFTKKNPSW